VVSVEAGLALQEAIKWSEPRERHGRKIGPQLAMVSSEMFSGATLGQALRAAGVPRSKT